MEGPMSKMTKEPPKRANYKGNIKFLNPLLAYQMRGEPLLCLEEHSPITITRLKIFIEVAYAHCNTIDTLCLENVNKTMRNGQKK